MNKTMINVLLFLTLVMGTMAILTFDVWADDTDIIPDDYEKHNFIFEWSYCSKYDTANSIFEYQYYYLDLDMYVPKNCVVFPYFSLYRKGNYKLNGFSLFFKDDEGNVTSSENIFDIYKNITNANVLKETFTFELSSGIYTCPVYMVLNDYHYTLNHKSLNKKDCSVTTTFYKYIFQTVYFDTNLKNFNYTVSQPFQLYSNTGYRYVTFTFDDLSSSIYLDGYSKDLRNAELCKFYENYLSVYNNNDYPEPKFAKAIRLGDTGTIQLTYALDVNKKSPAKVMTYNKIYVKLQGEKDWRTVENDDILELQKDVNSGHVSGILRFSDIVDVLGLQNATFEAVIWGAKYAYSTGASGTDLTKKIYSTSWVFSRYVLTENVIDEPDVSIDDLGNLKDVSNSSSGSDIKIDNVGGAGTGDKNNFGSSNIIAKDEADYSDVGSFFKSLNFDFSSIGKALSGSFSLVTGFASMIGNIFQNFFGDAVGVVALLAIGICIVLRVLGR